MEDKDVIKELKKLMEKTYKNKSDDEYKCRGDIKKSPNYEMLKGMIDKFIPSVKGYPSSDAKVLQDTLKTLEKPIWGKMVSEYMSKPDDTNFVYAAYFMLCYRALFCEVSMVCVSAEATENGFVYDQGRVTDRSRSGMQFLKKFSRNPDADVDHVLTEVKRMLNDDKIHQEAAAVSGIRAAAEDLATIADATFGAIGRVFKSALALNPISFFSALFSRAYDKKVEKFKKFDDLYQATVEAYNEYKKIPQSKRKDRIEHRYIKLMEKYNIKRENLRKQLEHYDRRAHEGDMYDDDDNDDVKETKETKSSSSSKKHEDKNNKNDESKTPQTASTVNTSDNVDDEDKKPAADDFDF